jgi:hypothetical protein
MNDIRRKIADGALRTIGAKFRLHGRDPSTGLDCVGVVDHSLKAAGLQPDVPSAYTFRNRSSKPFEKHFEASGLLPASGPIEAGDVILALAGPAQFHLLVATEAAQFVHAHAGLRRIVAMRGHLPWTILQNWRCTSQDLKDI